MGASTGIDRAAQSQEIEQIRTVIRKDYGLVGGDWELSHMTKAITSLCAEDAKTAYEQEEC